MKLTNQKIKIKKGYEVTLVVPCFNEEKFIAKTLECIKQAFESLNINYEIIVIDDCSSDLTYQKAQEFRESNRKMCIKIIQNSKNRGLSRCYCDAAFLGRGKYFRLVCGDNSESPESIKKIILARKKADMVLPYHPEVPGKSFMRRIVSALYTKIINRISGNRIKYYNGCALTTRLDVMRWGSYSFGFGFQADLITRLLAEGRSYIEIPVDVYHHENDAAASAFRFKNILSVLFTIIEIGLRNIRVSRDK